MNDIITKIEKVVETAQKFRNSYFWTPPYTAGGRRSYEAYHSIPGFCWTESGHDYTASYTVSCSCKNVYTYGTYTKDGAKTTLTAIKASLKRLQAMG